MALDSSISSKKIAGPVVSSTWHECWPEERSLQSAAENRLHKYAFPYQRQLYIWENCERTSESACLHTDSRRDVQAPY